MKKTLFYISMPLFIIMNLYLFQESGFSTEKIAKKKLEYVRFATPSTRSLNSLPLVMAEKRGFYRGEGITAEIFLGIKSTLILAGMISGEFDYGAPFGDLIRSSASGMPVKVLFVIGGQLPHSLITKPQIKKVTDLKGKIIGVSSLGSSEHFVARKVIQHFGMNPDKDLTIMASGPGMHLVALEAGSVDAVFTGPPRSILAKKKGYNEILKVADVVKMASIALGATEKKIRENPGQIKRMMRSLIRSIIYVKGHKPEMIKFLTEEWGFNKDVVDETYEAGIKEYSKDGATSETAIYNEIEMGKNLGMIKTDISLSKVVDFSLLKETLKEMGITQY